MKRHAKKAFTELKNLGCPVKTWYDGERGHFWIDGEEEGAEEWLDYWGVNSFGSKKLNDILQKNGLYWEWENSAVGCVHDI